MRSSLPTPAIGSHSSIFSSSLQRTSRLRSGALLRRCGGMFVCAGCCGSGTPTHCVQCSLSVADIITVIAKWLCFDSFIKVERDVSMPIRLVRNECFGRVLLQITVPSSDVAESTARTLRLVFSWCGHFHECAVDAVVLLLRNCEFGVPVYRHVLFRPRCRDSVRCRERAIASVCGMQFGSLLAAIRRLLCQEFAWREPEPSV